MGKHNIFISYSRQDEKIVHQMVSMLQKDGFSIWIDKTGIESGDAFKRVIVNAIEATDVVLFFSSEASNQSSWTTKEISVALYENKPIIPIKLDNSKYNTEIKFDLINLDYVDLTDGKITDFQYQRLLKALRTKCSTISPVNIAERKNQVISDQPETIISKNISGSQKSFIKSWKSIKLLAISLLVIIAICIGALIFQNNNTPETETLHSVTPDIAAILENPYWLQQRYVTEEDIQGMSSQQLRILRNCIYALHGRRFESHDLSSLFMKYEWYHPTVSEISISVLNEYERANIPFLKQRE